jgi:hypothetical protein
MSNGGERERERGGSGGEEMKNYYPTIVSNTVG